MDIYTDALLDHIDTILDAGVTDFTFGQWLMSPGFGGLAAVAAASIAFFGVSRNVKVQREANRKQQWWERAKWALDLTLNDDSTTRTVGFEVLDALASSEWAREHEYDVIEAAVGPTLEAYEEQARADEGTDTGVGTSGQAHLEPPSDGSGEGEH